MSAAALVAVGVVGAVPAAVASASPQQALNWTLQAPAVHPSARIEQSMAYDAATGTVVLFGGFDSTSPLCNTFQSLAQTWTWG